MKKSNQKWVIIAVIVIGISLFAAFNPLAFVLGSKTIFVADSVDVTGSFTGTRYSEWETRGGHGLECMPSPYVSSSWTCNNAKMVSIGTITAPYSISKADLKFYSTQREGSSSAWESGVRGSSTVTVYVKNQVTDSWEKAYYSSAGASDYIWRAYDIGNSVRDTIFTESDQCETYSYNGFTEKDCTYSPLEATSAYIRDGKIIDIKAEMSAGTNTQAYFGVNADWTEAINPCDTITCDNKCDGNIRLYSGVCDSISGECTYQKEECDNSCSLGTCVSTPPPQDDCGNDVCDSGECITCPGDCTTTECQVTTDCGNNVCDENECTSCPGDCTESDCGTGTLNYTYIGIAIVSALGISAIYLHLRNKRRNKWRY